MEGTQVQSLKNIIDNQRKSLARSLVAENRSETRSAVMRENT